MADHVKRDLHAKDGLAFLLGSNETSAETASVSDARDVVVDRLARIAWKCFRVKI
jgi:hypothetical protein